MITVIWETNGMGVDQPKLTGQTASLCPSFESKTVFYSFSLLMLEYGK